MSIRFKISYSIRSILFLLLVVVLTPILIIQGYIYYDRFQARRAREFQNNLEVARAAGLAFEAFVNGILQQELAIGMAVTRAAGIEPEDLDSLLLECAAASPAVRHFLLVGPDGEILASSSPTGTGVDIVDRRYFSQIAAGRRWNVSDLFRSKVTGEAVFTINHGIRDELNNFQMMVTATVIPDRLDQVLPIERIGNAGISLIDRQGYQVYHYPEDPVTWEQRDWVNRYPVVQEALSGRDVTTTLSMHAPDHERLVGFVPIKSVGWVAAAGRAEEDALRPIFSVLSSHAAMFLLVVLAAIAAALALSRPLAAAIDRLRNHAAAMGRGDITHLRVDDEGPSELKDLAEAFNRMAQKVSQRETALRESENRYRNLVQNANSAIIRWRNDGTIAFLNAYAQRLFGYSAEEVVGRHISLIMPQTESTGADLSGLADQMVAHPERYRNKVVENLLRDGRRVWITWTNRPIYDEDGRVVEMLSIGNDITELKQAETARRETEERFQTVVDNLAEGLFIHARSGRVIYCNPAAIRMHGFDEYWPQISAEEADATWEITGLNGRFVPFSSWLHHRVLQGERFQNLLAHVRRKDGKREFWASYSGVPIADEHGAVKFALITVRDVSKQMRAEQQLREVNRRLEQMVQERTALLAKTIEELKLANQQLDARAGQLAALAGELTMAEQRERRRLSIILHDSLQQHLAAVKMRIGGIAALDRPDDLRAELEGIESMMAESIQITRTLSADLSPQALHEGGLVAGLEWLARRMQERYGFNVRLTVESEPELPEEVKILVFESVRELLFNAFKHARVDQAEVHLQMRGEGLKICVTDQGAGFDPDRVKTSSGEAGGGFGLFSIRERLGLIGGSLQVDSAPGKGSRFTLNLSRPIPPGLLSEKPSISAATWGRPETIASGSFIRVLLADDHTLFRDGIARLLGKEPDIAVIGEAKDGWEAVELARRLSPNVILMDINMPVLNGIEATRIIRQESPGVRIIGLSMHEEENRAREMRDAGAVGYKHKTCPVAELVAAVRSSV